MSAETLAELRHIITSAQELTEHIAERKARASGHCAVNAEVLV